MGTSTIVPLPEKLSWQLAGVVGCAVTKMWFHSAATPPAFSGEMRTLASAVFASIRPLVGECAKPVEMSSQVDVATVHPP
jgi:hypothetical protein